jgi:hypothetical protein
MRFYWIRDRVAQGHFVVHWSQGSDNLTDYFTKHHSPSHHRLMGSRYLLELHRPSHAIRGGKGVLIPTVSPRSTSRQSLTTTADALAQYADKKTDHGLNMAMTANKLKTPQQ